MGRLEAAKTVIEMADVAFKAVEFSHHHLPHESHEKSGDGNEEVHSLDVKEKELEALRSENQRLRDLLEQNLKLLQNISESPCLLEDCPPDLHDRLMDAVECPKFLNRLKSFQEESDALGMDLQSAEILINVGFEEPSLWIWVADEMVHGKSEEKSGIDNENYIVISEEQVVDGIANFMARCILLNPKAKNLAPEEMQKNLSKALSGVSRTEKILNIWHAAELFYLMATWGLALAGLYRSRAVLRHAARGVHATSKLAIRVLK